MKKIIFIFLLIIGYILNQGLTHIYNNLDKVIESSAIEHSKIFTDNFTYSNSIIAKIKNYLFISDPQIHYKSASILSQENQQKLKKFKIYISFLLNFLYLIILIQVYAIFFNNYFYNSTIMHSPPKNIKEETSLIPAFVKQSFRLNNIELTDDNPEHLCGFISDILNEKIQIGKERGIESTIEKLKNVFNNIYLESIHNENKNFAGNLIVELNSALGVKPIIEEKFIYNKEDQQKNNKYQILEKIENGEMVEIVYPAWEKCGKVLISGLVRKHKV